MLKFFFHAVRVDAKENYGRLSGVLWEFVSTVMMLLMYWYTAKSFSPAFAELGPYTNYFSFIIVGEFVLTVPGTLLELVWQKIKKANGEGTMDIFLSAPYPSPYFALVLSAASLPREFLRSTAVLLLAVFCFGFHLQLSQILFLLALQFFSLPVFFGLGMFGAAVVVVMGRGEHVLRYLAWGLMALAGTYFPVTVFPKIVQSLFGFLSPYNLLLHTSRTYLQTGTFAWSSFSFLLAQGFFLSIAGFFVLSFSFQVVRRRGVLLIA